MKLAQYIFIFLIPPLQIAYGKESASHSVEILEEVATGLGQFQAKGLTWRSPEFLKSQISFEILKTAKSNYETEFQFRCRTLWQGIEELELYWPEVKAIIVSGSSFSLDLPKIVQKDRSKITPRSYLKQFNIHITEKGCPNSPIPRKALKSILNSRFQHDVGYKKLLLLSDNKIKDPELKERVSSFGIVDNITAFLSLLGADAQGSTPLNEANATNVRFIPTGFIFASKFGNRDKAESLEPGLYIRRNKAAVFANTNFGSAGLWRENEEIGIDVATQQFNIASILGADISTFGGFTISFDKEHSVKYLGQNQEETNSLGGPNICNHSSPEKKFLIKLTTQLDLDGRIEPGIGFGTLLAAVGVNFRIGKAKKTVVSWSVCTTKEQLAEVIRKGNKQGFLRSIRNLKVKLRKLVPPQAWPFEKDGKERSGEHILDIGENFSYLTEISKYNGVAIGGSAFYMSLIRAGFMWTQSNAPLVVSITRIDQNLFRIDLESNTSNSFLKLLNVVDFVIWRKQISKQAESIRSYLVNTKTKDNRDAIQELYEEGKDPLFDTEILAQLEVVFPKASTVVEDLPIDIIGEESEESSEEESEVESENSELSKPLHVDELEEIEESTASDKEVANALASEETIIDLIDSTPKEDQRIKIINSFKAIGIQLINIVTSESESTIHTLDIGTTVFSYAVGLWRSIRRMNPFGLGKFRNDGNDWKISKKEIEAFGNSTSITADGRTYQESGNAKREVKKIKGVFGSYIVDRQFSMHEKGDHSAWLRDFYHQFSAIYTFNKMTKKRYPIIVKHLDQVFSGSKNLFSTNTSEYELKPFTGNYKWALTATYELGPRDYQILLRADTNQNGIFYKCGLETSRAYLDGHCSYLFEFWPLLGYKNDKEFYKEYPSSHEAQFFTSFFNSTIESKDTEESLVIHERERQLIGEFLKDYSANYSEAFELIPKIKVNLRKIIAYSRGLKELSSSGRYEGISKQHIANSLEHYFKAIDEDLPYSKEKFFENNIQKKILNIVDFYLDILQFTAQSAAIKGYFLEHKDPMTAISFLNTLASKGPSALTRYKIHLSLELSPLQEARGQAPLFYGMYRLVAEDLELMHSEEPLSKNQIKDIEKKIRKIHNIKLKQLFKDRDAVVHVLDTACNLALNSHFLTGGLHSLNSSFDRKSLLANFVMQDRFELISELQGWHNHLIKMFPAFYNQDPIKTPCLDHHYNQ